MRQHVISAAIVCVGAVALWHATDGARAITTEGARRVQVITAAPVVSAVSLTDHTGGTIAVTAPIGGVALVEFVYTTCPTICVSAGILFSQLRDRLAVEGLAPRVHMYSVSFDPRRDRPDALAAYADAHGIDGGIWKIGTPGAAALPRILSDFGVTVIPDGFDGYEHNAAIHIVNSDNRLIGILDIDNIPAVVNAVRRLK
ncbi:MAG: protein SCO1/2 [Paracoccaceae bacterium]